MEIQVVYLAGRCVNGYNGSRGTKYHAKVNGTVLCGATYGARSAGFYDADEGQEVTCPKCLKKMKKVNELRAQRNKIVAE